MADANGAPPGERVLSSRSPGDEISILVDEDDPSRSIGANLDA